MKKYFSILCLLLVCLLTSCVFVGEAPINSLEIMKNLDVEYIEFV